MNEKLAFDELMRAKENVLEENDSVVSFTPKKKNKILVPYELDKLHNYYGILYGYLREDTGVHTIIGWLGNEPDAALNTKVIGAFDNTLVNMLENGLDHLCNYFGLIPNHAKDYHGVKGIIGFDENNGKSFYFLDGNGNKQKLCKEVYSITQDVFSRNTGLLETDKMAKKTVLIVGCGSVGSTLALQLARSGVGRFVLVDTDTIEIHNICRHQCNLTDVGRFKTIALRDRIIAINPSAVVKCFNSIIQNVTSSELDDFIDAQSIIVGCGDNRLSDAYSCEEAYRKNIPFISIGFWTNAFVCEIVTCIPQRGDTCYRCALKGPIEKSIAVSNKNRRYVRPDAEEIAVFEPGISIDIEYGTSIGSKIVIDALNLNDSNYVPKVLHTLTQYTLVCNTNNVKIDNNDDETSKVTEALKADLAMFSNPLQVVRNTSFEKGNCRYCSR